MNNNIVKRYVELREKDRKVLDKRLSSELEPFLEGIKELKKSSNEYQIFREAYIDFKGQVHDKKELFSSMLPTKSVSANLEDNLYRLFLYLGMVESIGKKIVDIIILLLVANGYDFRIRRRQIVTMNELDNEEEYISIGTKLDFLRRKGLCKVASVIDIDFRNNIAHLNFQIKNGSVDINGKNALATALINLEKLTAAVDIINNLLIKLDAEIDLTS